MSIHILGICGSLRQESSNQGLIKLAQKLAPTEVTFTVFDKIGSLPFYNEDLEDPSLTPASVIEWRNIVKSSDALFIAAPEYNFGPQPFSRMRLIGRLDQWVNMRCLEK